MLAIMVIVLFALFIIAIIYSIVIYIRASRSLKRAKERVERHQHMEKMGRLRHRDLEAFAKELNIMRAQRGKKGIPKAALKRIQYDPRYNLDED